MVLLQEEVLDQERARLEALRQRDQNRLHRFLDSKERSIGIDKSYLDKQGEEKRKLELAEKEEERSEAENLKQLVQCLDHCEAAAQEAKQRALEEVKRTLDEQARQPKNNARGNNGPIDLNSCGPSSLQCFSGEDHAHATRRKAQAEQVKLWCAEHTVEKKKALDAQRREEQEWANYVLEQDRIRAELEEAAGKQRDEEARLRQLENLEYARQARLRKEQELAAEKEAQKLQSQYLQTCPLLTEDTKLATNANAEHRYRPDHFKGLEREQVQRCFRENDAVLEEKIEQQRMREVEEATWAKYHAEITDKMREAEEAKRRVKEEENRLQRQILARQMEELERRKTEMERNRLPEIGTDFFKRFGSSL